MSVLLSDLEKEEKIEFRKEFENWYFKRGWIYDIIIFLALIIGIIAILR